jgi:predicted AAA+ superfamily ATPase
VEDPLRVRDLFVYLVQDSGAVFNAAHRADDLEADPRTVRAWVEMLEDTYLLASLPRRSGRKASSRLRSKPRLYATDHGLVNAFAALAAPAHDPALRGRVFEAVVYRHLREVARQADVGADAVSYLRIGDREEIDFVVSLAGGDVVVEVTASRSLDADKLRRFGAVAEKYLPQARRLLLHGGLIEEQRNGVAVMPLSRFLLDPRAAVAGEGGTS